MAMKRGGSVCVVALVLATVAGGVIAGCRQSGESSVRAGAAASAELPSGTAAAGQKTRVYAGTRK